MRARPTARALVAALLTVVVAGVAFAAATAERRDDERWRRVGVPALQDLRGAEELARAVAVSDATPTTKWPLLLDSGHYTVRALPHGSFRGESDVRLPPGFRVVERGTDPGEEVEEYFIADGSDPRGGVDECRIWVRWQPRGRERYEVSLFTQCATSYGTLS